MVAFFQWLYRSILAFLRRHDPDPKLEVVGSEEIPVDLVPWVEVDTWDFSDCLTEPKIHAAIASPEEMDALFNEMVPDDERSTLPYVEAHLPVGVVEYLSAFEAGALFPES